MTATFISIEPNGLFEFAECRECFVVLRPFRFGFQAARNRSERAISGPAAFTASDAFRHQKDAIFFREGHCRVRGSCYLRKTLRRAARGGAYLRSGPWRFFALGACGGVNEAAGAWSNR